jgi:hypothetical protein
VKASILLAGAFSAFVTTQTTADATLVYELTDAEGKVTEKRLSIRNFFIRVDDSATPNQYLLYQAGKFFPLYRVDADARTYQRLTQKVKPTLQAGLKTAKPIEKTPHPVLKPEGKKGAVADIPCRVVTELRDGKPAIEHCMANIGNLNITTREIRTLVRWLAAAREKELGWIGIGSKDEEFAAIQSREEDGKRGLRLKSVSRDPLPQDYLKISRDFKEDPLEKETTIKQEVAEEKAETEEQVANEASEPGKQEKTMAATEDVMDKAPAVEKEEPEQTDTLPDQPAAPIKQK